MWYMVSNLVLASAPRIKSGSKAEAAVKKAKAANMHKAFGCVELSGVPLKNSFNFRYLGFMYQADGNWRHAVEVRMVLARTRFGTMYHIWYLKIFSLEVKLQLCGSVVLSVLVYGCEAWWLVESMMRSLNGWNSRCLHLMTGRSYREETPRITAV